MVERVRRSDTKKIAEQKKSRKGVGGRPSKYDQRYCDMLVTCGSEGMSLTAFAGSIGTTRETLLNWANQYPEFLLAKNLAIAAAACFWERMLVNFARTGKGNAAAIIFALKNRVKEEWRDQVHQRHDGEVTQTQVLKLDPEVLAGLPTERLEMFREVLALVQRGATADEIGGASTQLGRAESYAQSLRAGSPTQGRA